MEIQEKKIKPILKYPGAKWRLAPWILENIPKCESYLEPYFGSGAIFFNKEPSKIETINDIDGEIVNFFKMCREKPVELARGILLTPWSRDELMKCKEKSSNEIEQARRTAVTCFMTFGSRRVSNTWRYTTGNNKNHGPNNTHLWGKLPEVIFQVADRLKDAQIENKPAIKLIEKFNGPDVLIYLDTPYIKSTRTLNGDQYYFEMTNEEHEELLEAVIKHKGKIILSGYDNEMYNEALKGWEKKTTKTRIERGRIREETIWMNYSLLENQIGMEI